MYCEETFPQRATWIRWKTYDQPRSRDRAFTTTTGNTVNRKRVSLARINSKINYYSSLSHENVNEKKNRIVSNSLSKRLREDPVSIDRFAAPNLVSCRTTEDRKASGKVNENRGSRETKAAVGSEKTRKLTNKYKQLSNPTVDDIHNKLSKRMTMGMCDAQNGKDCEYCAYSSDSRNEIISIHYMQAASDNICYCDFCRHIDNDYKQEKCHYSSSNEYEKNLDYDQNEQPLACDENCEYCRDSSHSVHSGNSNYEPTILRPSNSYALNARLHGEEDANKVCNTRRTRLQTINKFLSRKYRKLRRQLRSKSLPSPTRRESCTTEGLDYNMNEHCSICENQNQSDLKLESLLACSCKSKSLLDVDRLSLFVHPSTNFGLHENCDCCADTDSCSDSKNFSSEECSSNADNQKTNYLFSDGTVLCDLPNCEECARQANSSPVFDVYTGKREKNDARGLLSDDMLTLSDLKKYGDMSTKFLVRQQPTMSQDKKQRIYSKKRRMRKDELSRTTFSTRWIDSFALCFQCLLSKHLVDSSSSGGSGSDDEGGSEEGEPEEHYIEHGSEVSDGDDSDGGDSGSGSGGDGDDESLNSAELYDDQLNALEAKDNNNIEGSDDGGEPGSECTDSLTELGTEESDEDDSSDSDDSDNDFDISASDGVDSLQSIIIYERE